MQPFFCKPETTPVLTLAKATILFKASMGYGYTTMQVRDLEIRFERYAQYDRAVIAHFVPKGKRGQRAIVGTYAPSLVVLDGWVDPKVPDAYHAEQDAGNGVAVQRGRALSCSPMWAQEARAAAAAAGKVVADYHDHDPLERKFAA